MFTLPDTVTEIETDKNYLYCRTRTRTPNPMATLSYAENVHIVHTRTRSPTPYFCTVQESESKSDNIFKSLHRTVELCRDVHDAPTQIPIGLYTHFLAIGVRLSRFRALWTHHKRNRMYVESWGLLKSSVWNKTALLTRIPCGHSTNGFNSFRSDSAWKKNTFCKVNINSFFYS